MSGAVDLAVDGSTAVQRGRAPGPQKQFWWSETDARSLSFDVAGDTQTFDAAFRLVHDRYVMRRYMRPHPTGRRLSLYNALPTTKTFVAKRWEHLVGTVTLIEDSLIGLPMEDIYRKELNKLRAEGRNLAEVSALALAGEHRPAGLQILMHLVRMLVLYAAEIAGVDDLCIAVNPRHEDFYRKACYFTRLGDLKEYQKVNGAPAVALRLDLTFIRTLIAQIDEDGRPDDEFHEFLFGDDNRRSVLDRVRRGLSRSALTPEQFVGFFRGHESLRDASPDALAYVQSFYSDISVERLQDRSAPARDRSPGCLEPSLAVGV